jgi:hypothetical protein
MTVNTVLYCDLAVMSELGSEVRYEETGDRAVLRSDHEGEWVESDSVVELAEWV